MSQASITPLFSAEDIAARVSELAHDIVRTCPPDLLVVALLRGSFVFAADLIRALHAAGASPQVDFMTLSSYGNSTQSSGAPTQLRDMNENVQGRHLLLIDDILESGRTLQYAKELLSARGAASVHVAVFLEKPGKCVTDIRADFTGFRIPDHFVVGYGLDYANFYRELPFIGVLVLDNSSR